MVCKMLAIVTDTLRRAGLLVPAMPKATPMRIAIPQEIATIVGPSPAVAARLRARAN
jgi:hypothetical protein